MSLWAIVPVKPLKDGKSRLSEVFTNEERLLFNRYLLKRTLEQLRAMPQIDKILVISRDPAVLQYAEDLDLDTLLELEWMDLNTALSWSSYYAYLHGSTSCLILPTDLPLLNYDELLLLISQNNEPNSVVIVPDRHQEGTNALLLNPCGIIPFAFGNSSFHSHSQLAKLAGARKKVQKIDTIELDLDFPEDLTYFENKMQKSILKIIENSTI